jgi:hypothetical protein
VRFVRLFLYLVLLAAFATPARAQKEDWLPVTKQDLEIKEVPGEPGAGAIQLYYADFIFDPNHSEFLYRRIKVLNEKGRDKYSDVEIEIPPEMSISNLKARTIRPDGTIVEFSGKPFQKTIVKGKGIKILAKSFSMPEVTIGSIVEYKYHIDWDEHTIYDNSWNIQHDLYTVKEDFFIRPYEGELEGGMSTLSYSIANMKERPKNAGKNLELKMQNVPAFDAEESMPPEDNYRPQIRFFYGTGNYKTAEEFWQQKGRDWNSKVEHFINRKEVKDAATAAIAGEADPEKRLRKLYVRAQQIRNLSYERERTKEELKTEKLKGNENAADVLTRGVGTSEDITLLFAAMARAAGFETSVLKASNRKERFFDLNVLSPRQLPAVLVRVIIDGKNLFLEPGVKYCPFAMLPWPHTSTRALVLDKKGGAFIDVPGAAYDQAITRKKVAVSVAPDGSLKGKLTVEFEGHDALQHRLSALETDEAGRKKDVEDEVRGWLGNTGTLTLIASEGWEATNEPLKVIFTIEIPNYASVAGKRLLMPALFFQTQNRNVFKHSERKYPVYFPYAFQESDWCQIEVPPDFTVESVPGKQTIGLPYALYESTSELAGTKLINQRMLAYNGVFVEPGRFAEVKDFFAKVQSADETQVVLRSGGMNAQKAN